MSPAKTVLRDVYPRLGTGAQNALISAYGLIYRHRRLGGRFSRLVREFKSRDGWRPEQMQAHVDETLCRILRRAWQAPYYRHMWRALGFEEWMLGEFRAENLRLLPVVPKSDLRNAPEAFVVKTHTRLAHHESTSGSTGEPVTITTTARLQQAYMAAREARSFAWAGTSMLRRKATIGGRPVVPLADSEGPYHRFNFAERQCYLSAFHIGPRTASTYVDALREWHPQVLTGYASSYFSLARMMLEQGLTLGYRPDALILCADKPTATMKSVIREAFGTRPFEEYGSVENAVLATECDAGALHVNSDFGIVEIVDDEGRPLGPGEEGRIVCTSLLNDVQPLVRYDIGDLGRWAARPCPCGRSQLPVLEEVVGRIEDAVVGPDGREIVRICSLQDVPHVIASQLVQERLDLIRVRVIADRGFNEADERLIRDIIGTRRLGPVRIEIERVSELERTPAGKVRRVIRRLPALEDELATAS
jgi:phenylacetate-CoA ligase